MKRRLLFSAMASLLFIFLLGHFSLNNWATMESPSSLLRRLKTTIPTPVIVSHLFKARNFSECESRSLAMWNRLSDFAEFAFVLPNFMEALDETFFAWTDLVREILEEKEKKNDTRLRKENSCPYSIKIMDSGPVNGSNGFEMKIPCGMVQGSSVTVIGTPDGLLGEFKIELLGAVLPGDPEPPVIIQVNIQLSGDWETEEPVIVLNAWSNDDGWGDEERCPSQFSDDTKVDGMEKCSGDVGKEERTMTLTGSFFPFRRGRLAVATLHIGAEGIQMTVDGKHVTSFAYRPRLEPWMVNAVQISGDFNLVSLLAGGLPTLEDFENVPDLAALKPPMLSPHQPLAMFIGVVSTANNFKRRMAIRRSWMQYDAIRSGRVMVQFFVGLHKNRMVNEDLWKEARSFGDMQLLPFVDYYSLISLKTISICIYGIEVVSADFVMKTDDDSFVRVDKILSTLNRVNITNGLLFGRINNDSKPYRDPDSKWYITSKEWPQEKYPIWAHGPGYIISGDVAKFVSRRLGSRNLKLFKLEDVAMGIWVAQMAEEGVAVRYVNEEKIITLGCEAGYVVAHYQRPRDMLCLWQTLRETREPTCCAKW